MPLKIKAPRAVRSERVPVSIPEDVREQLEFYRKLLSQPGKDVTFSYVVTEACRQALEADREFRNAWESRRTADGSPA